MEPSVENTENLNVNGTLAVNFAEQMHQQQQTRASSAAESPSHYDDEFGQPSTLSLGIFKNFLFSVEYDVCKEAFIQKLDRDCNKWCGL